MSKIENLQSPKGFSLKECVVNIFGLIFPAASIQDPDGKPVGSISLEDPGAQVMINILTRSNNSGESQSNKKG